MTDISEYELTKTFTDVRTEQLKSIAKLLEMIDCPSGFRGLSRALATLEYLFSLYPNRVSKLLNIDNDTIQETFLIIRTFEIQHYSVFTRNTQGKGWKSERPIYSLLHMFSNYRTTHAASSLLLFLEHYLNNETRITSQSRAEECVRAFRLLFSDELTRNECFKDVSINGTVHNIFVLRERLKQKEDEISLHAARISYLYQLEHFFRLDWIKRDRQHRKTPKQIRAHYSRRKFERITGSENLITASLNDQRLSREFEQAGVTKIEDLPDITVVSSSSPPSQLQPYEHAGTSVVKDRAKHWFKTSKANIDIRRCHNLLPTSRTILQPHELKHLWNALITPSQGVIGGIEKHFIQAVLLLVLITARDLNSVLNIKQASEPREVGFLFNGDTIFLNVAPTPTTLSPINNDLLLPTSAVISIQLPKQVVSRLKPYFSDKSVGLALEKNNAEWLSAIQGFLKHLNRKLSIQISLNRIEQHLINWVSAKESFDPVLLDILADKTRYQCRSARHYAYYTEVEVNHGLHSIWNGLFNEASLTKTAAIGAATPVGWQLSDAAYGVGSEFTPKKLALIAWIKEKVEILLSYRPFTVTSSLEELVNYHNAYTLYTIIMLKSGTGYRAVFNPLPCLDLALLRYKGICISDKDSKILFNHTRVVACPDILKSQISLYQEHINTFANLIALNLPYFAQQYFTHSSHLQHLSLISKTERLEHFLAMKNSSASDGIFLFFSENEEDSNYNKKVMENSSPTFLSKHFPFPLNFGRHYMRRHLQMNKTHQELIKFQLGHWVTGETALEKFSEISHVDAIQALLPTLNSMMEELGWFAIPSALTRKRA